MNKSTELFSTSLSSDGHKHTKFSLRSKIFDTNRTTQEQTFFKVNSSLEKSNSCETRCFKRKSRNVVQML